MIQDDTVDDEENILEQLDKEAAKQMLEKLKKGEATAQDFEAIRKYLDFKGYRGPSPTAMRKTGVKKDPRLDLDSLPDDVVSSFS